MGFFTKLVDWGANQVHASDNVKKRIREVAGITSIGMPGGITSALSQAGGEAARGNLYDPGKNVAQQGADFLGRRGEQAFEHYGTGAAMAGSFAAKDALFGGPQTATPSGGGADLSPAAQSPNASITDTAAGLDLPAYAYAPAGAEAAAGGSGYSFFSDPNVIKGAFGIAGPLINGGLTYYGMKQSQREGQEMNELAKQWRAEDRADWQKQFDAQQKRWAEEMGLKREEMEMYKNKFDWEKSEAEQDRKDAYEKRRYNRVMDFSSKLASQLNKNRQLKRNLSQMWGR